MSASRNAGLALLCAASFMVILDSSIVVVAIPSIESDLEVPATSVQWVASAYAVAFGGLLLLGGRVADLLGRRRVFAVGTAMFVLASLGCGLAPTIEVLVLSRAAQGISAAVMTPTALSLVTTMFEEGPARNRALGVWGATGGVGGTAGALVGGPVTEYLGWPWIFLLNVPAGSLILCLTPVLLPFVPAAAERRSFDIAGALAVTGALVLAVYAVVQVPESGWTGHLTLGSLAASVALLVGFVVIERRARDPLVPLQVFSSRPFVAGNLLIVTIGFAVFGAIAFALTLYAQGELGYSAVEFGLVASVNAAMAVVGSMLSQRLVGRLGVRTCAAGALVLAGVACLWMAMLPSSDHRLGVMLVGLAVFGAGLGSGTVVGTIAALSHVSERHSGVASGMTNASFHIGGALGIAVLSSLAAARSADLAAAGLASEAAAQAFRTSFFAAATAVALGLLVVWLLLRANPRAEHVEAAMATPTSRSVNEREGQP